MNLEKNQFNILSKLLHTVTAILFIAALVIAVKAVEKPKIDINLFELHQSIGLLIFLLTISRVVWLRVTGKPKAIGTPIAKLAAYMGHYALYAVVFLFPLSGLINVAAKCKPTYFFNLIPIPGFPERTTWLIEYSSTIHIALAWGSAALLVVHVLASLYHHYILKDATLVRMLGRSAQ